MKTKYRLVKILFALSLLGSSALLPFSAASGGELLERIVAVVNDDVIMQGQLEEELRTIVASLKKRGITRLPPHQILQKQVLDKMILEQIQLQLAERTGIRVDDNQLNETLRSMAARNGIRMADLRRVVERDGYDFVDFRENLRKEHIIKRLQERYVLKRVNVTEREIDDFLSNQEKQGNVDYSYHLRHILINVPGEASPELLAEKRAKAQAILDKLRGGADFAQIAVEVSDSSQALDGGDLGWRKGGEVPSLFASPLSTMKVGDISELLRNSSGFHIIQLAGKRGGEQQIVTQTKVRHILIKTSEVISDEDAQRRLEQVRERLLGGEDFATLAQAHSEDSGSARDGGSLGWVDPGSMVSEFEEVMNSLKPGELSKVFKSRFGWHLMQVEDRREHDNTEQARRNKATRQIRQRKIEEELQAWNRQLREESYVEYRLDES